MRNFNHILWQGLKGNLPYPVRQNHIALERAAAASHED